MGPYVLVKTFLWTLRYSFFYLHYINYRKKDSKKPREDYSKVVRKVLKEWLHKHLTNPYPSDAEKLYLANKTGLTVLQVDNWFINARRREFKSLIDEQFESEELHNIPNKCKKTKRKRVVEASFSNTKVRVHPCHY